jgi:RNA polymerase sigma factor (sigma-70 family)
VRTISVPAPRPFGPLCSKRLLALSSDETLVEQIRRGNEAAFSVAFERHAAGLLGFCRHMVGSREDAEDAVQQTFAAAFRDLARPQERDLALKPWLYAIARNRCLSVLRLRREHTALDFDLPTEGLTEQVERRADLRDLLRDLVELPEDQRAALLLSEAGDLSHAEVAGVLGCDVANVKALVFRARSGLIQRREARETPCTDIRKQLATLRGSSLRRNGLRHHLRSCAPCRAYHEQVEHHRRMLAAALPAVPSLGLRSSVLGAAGLGGGSAGGGVVAGIGAGLSASLATGTLVHLAAVGVLVVSGVASWKALVKDSDSLPGSAPRAAAPAATSSRPEWGTPAGAKRATSPGVQPSVPRFLDPRPGQGAVEQQAPGDALPIPGRPEGDWSLGQDQNTNRLPLAGEDPPTGFGRGRDSPVADVGPESDGRGPAAAPPIGTQVHGGPRVDAPVRGGAPSTAPDSRGPPASALDRGGPPSSAPDRGGPPSSVPDRGGSPSSVPDRGGPPSSAPHRGGSPSSVPDRGGPPSSAPDRGGPPSSVPDRGGSPSSVPDRGGPPSSVPDRGGSRSSGPAERPPPGAAPVQRDRPAPKSPVEARANTTALTSPQVAARQQAPVYQPASGVGPREQAKGPGK